MCRNISLWFYLTYPWWLIILYMLHYLFDIWIFVLLKCLLMSFVHYLIGFSMSFFLSYCWVLCHLYLFLSVLVDVYQLIDFFNKLAFLNIFLFSISWIFVIVMIIFLLLPAFSLLCSFSSFLRYKCKLLIWDLFSFLMKHLVL